MLASGPRAAKLCVDELEPVCQLLSSDGWCRLSQRQVGDGKGMLAALHCRVDSAWHDSPAPPGHRQRATLLLQVLKTAAKLGKLPTVLRRCRPCRHTESPVPSCTHFLALACQIRCCCCLAVADRRQALSYSHSRP